MGREKMDDRVGQIRKVAIRLFNKYGFKGTSVEMIGKAVGLKKSSLYHHIKSKNDLLFNVFEDVIEDVNMGLKNIVHSDLPPDQKLKAAIENHIEKQIIYFDEYRLYLQERKFLPRKFEAKYRKKRKLNEKYFETIILEGMEKGVFRQNIDLRLTVLSLLGSLNWMTQWYKPKGRLSQKEIIESIWDLTAHSISTSPHHKS